jgi:hypothetical protein
MAEIVRALVRGGNTTKLGWAVAGSVPSVPGMHVGAHTPEELETLLEDAFVMKDRGALSELFDPQAVLGGDALKVARGRGEIVPAVEVMWAREHLYLAAPQRVLQTRGTALIASQGGTSVAIRSREGLWRYAISLLHGQPRPQRRGNE